MVPLVSLWIPILVSAVLVFLVSSVIHMVLGYHRTDLVGVPAEDAVMDALRPFDLPPGDYMVPHGGSMAAMKDPVFVEKLKRGPVAMMTVYPSGSFTMGGSLAQWFAFSVLVSLFAAYVAGRALGPGAAYLDVFRFAGTVAFAGYALAQFQDSIWYKRKWSTTLKNVFDGLIYALVTAGVFGWLWPAAA
ncbi:MAG TPA: hypothetical protein VK922_05580 [Gemmatimonadaceae bacterium]|nr:hypothetical protein [Gemmatimonadaceae bacterium]